MFVFAPIHHATLHVVSGLSLRWLGNSITRVSEKKETLIQKFTDGQPISSNVLATKTDMLIKHKASEFFDQPTLETRFDYGSSMKADLNFFYFHGYTKLQVFGSIAIAATTGLDFRQGWPNPKFLSLDSILIFKRPTVGKILPLPPSHVNF